VIVTLSTKNTVLEGFVLNVLALDKSIRWVGVASSEGELLLVKRRKDLVPLMTHEENQEYTLSAIRRHKSRVKFQEKIGKLLYALGKYEKLTRVVAPINDNFYLLITFDVEELNFDYLMVEKVIPFVTANKLSIPTK
jgi:hypothetical protein